MHMTTTTIPFPRAVVLASAAGPLVALVAILMVETTPPTWLVALLAVVCAVAVCHTATAGHSLVIDPDEVLLRYRPLLTRRIATRDVVRFEVLPHVHPMRYGGWGLRVATGNVLAFVNRPGPALLMEPARGRTSVIVLASAEEAEAVRRRLEETTGRTVERRSA